MLLHLQSCHFNTVNIARAKWQNSSKNISPLKCYKLQVRNIILQMKCYVLNITAATALILIYQRHTDQR